MQQFSMHFSLDFNVCRLKIFCGVIFIKISIKIVRQKLDYLIESSRRRPKKLISTKDNSTTQYCMAIAILTPAAQSTAEEFDESPAEMHSS